MDVDHIGPGLDYVEILDEQVAKCDIVLAVIGKSWLLSADDSGQRRLEKPEDFVRIEIESALRREKRLVPILVNDAQMPNASDLPVSLHPLTRRQFMRLSHETFGTDVERIILALRQMLKEEAKQLQQEEAEGQQKKPNGIIRDIDAPWCPQMLLLPAGRFVMGSPESEAHRMIWERPQHEVAISKPFLLGRYAVTFDEYDHFCEATNRKKSEDQGWGRGKLPVIDVNWEDASAYCAWLSEATGRLYHLPSEAQWEYACRAGTETPFSFGVNITIDQANFNGNQPFANPGKGMRRRRTVAAGSLPPNSWGLHEMHGNVLEWCADWYGDYLPKAVTDPQGPPDGSLRVLRGGSWNNDAQLLRSAWRYPVEPDVRGSNIGFRCAGVQEES